MALTPIVSTLAFPRSAIHWTAAQSKIGGSHYASGIIWAFEDPVYRTEIHLHFRCTGMEVKTEVWKPDQAVISLSF